jgi:Skp family chaperone for outer membrane proteins
MRPSERFLVLGGLILAIALALTGPGRNAAIADSTSADTYKIGTVDVYVAIEKIMAKDDMKKAREDTSALWQSKAQAIEKEMKQLEDTFKVLPKDNPQLDDLTKQAQAKQAEYQKVAQERQQDLERLNASQLIESYKRVREATNAVAQRLGYTHVFCNRSFDRPMETVTVATTLQELLARPLVVGIAADDITKPVLGELKLE